MKNNNLNLGILSGITACIIWGFLPFFWKLLDGTSSNMILFHRTIWSCIILGIYLYFKKDLLKTIKLIFNKKSLLLLVSSSFSLVFGWYIFIWAISQNFVTEVGLGYYISPLISVIIGILFLKEKITFIQFIGIILTVIGFIFKVFDSGEGKIIALMSALLMAFLQAVYGFLKKITPNIKSISGLFLETFLSMPIIIIFMFFTLKNNGDNFFLGYDYYGISLLIMTGVATILPLIFFVYSASKIPLSLLGFIQYIPPTIIVGIGIYQGDNMGFYSILSFVFILIGIIIFSLSAKRN